MASIYIHIPFCQRICNYCDFPKRVGTKAQIDDYLQALEKEIKMYNVNCSIDTLYLGGGTPSILDNAQLIYLSKIINQFNFKKNYEFTIECNPEHITTDKIKIFKDMGINRISLGVQTFNNRLLKLLNRAHDDKLVYEVVSLIQDQGIENINIDLIYAIPGQTIEDTENDLNIISKLNVNHVSAYSLILENKTVFNKWCDENKMKLVDNDLEADMYLKVIEILKNYGFHHYEISNFAKPSFEAKHNKVYWENKEYYGFGMGASGYINSIRYSNEYLLSNYINKVINNQLPILEKNNISFDEKVKEAMLLGLRLIDGINIIEFNAIYNINLLEYFKKELSILTKQELIIINDYIKLSKKGLFYGNDVFQMFI